MEKELAHYMKFDGLLPNNEPVAKNDVSEPKIEVSKVLLIYTVLFHTDLGSLVGNTQWENFRIILPRA